MLIRTLAVLVLAVTAGTALAQGCPACRGTGTMEIDRDRSFEKIREAQGERGMWCNVCSAMGLYDVGGGDVGGGDGDGDGDELREEGPCTECSLPALEEAPPEAADALEVHMRDWWRDHDASRTIFIKTDYSTLSTDFEDMDLKKEARAFARQRKQIAEHTPGRGVGRGSAMSRHERAHLWIQRLDDGYHFCNDVTGLEDDAESVHQAHYRFNCILFKDASDDGTLNQKLGQLYRRGDGNLNFTPVSASVGSDDAGWARMMHNLGHIWVERLHGGNTQKGIQGWLISGMKLHTQVFFNAGISQSVATEVSTARGWGGPKRVQQSIYKDVKKGKADFVGMLAKQWEAMSTDDQMLSLSLVDFLSASSPSKFRKLLEGLAVEGLSFDEALRASHRMTPGMLEAAWVKFVLQAYRGDERKTDPLRGYDR